MQTSVIHKILLQPGHNVMQLPCASAKALAVGLTSLCPCLWYEREAPHTVDITNCEPADTACQMTTVETLCVMAGEPFEFDMTQWRYVGTLTHYMKSMGGDIVIHVYVKGF